MKTAYLIIVLAACTSSNASPPKQEPTTPPVKNIVCERFKLVNQSAVCTPEFSGVGEHNTHSATVKVGSNIVSCIVNDATLSVVCGDAISVIQPEQKPAPTPPKK